ncbi:MAG: 8-amino-7-oxononanoate synthase [Nocardioidaceae bacterium]
MSLNDWLNEHRESREVAGLERTLRPRPPRSDVIDLAGNDYLGLATDPRVTKAAADAATTWGAGAGASRLVTGSLDLHAELERSLAAFAGHQSALTFSTGYHANLGAVTALTDRDTLLVSDAHVHASLVDACRLARPGGLSITPHNDLGAIRTALRDRGLARALVIVESVYSVLGDAAPLPELATLCEGYDAVLIVDEAHAIGVAGKDGHGLVASHGLAGRAEVITTNTLSKALGSQGGAVMGSALVIEHLINTARPFIYDTGLAPAAAAGALAALGVVAAEPLLPHRALDISGRLADALHVPIPAGAVLSVPMAGPREALRAQDILLADGIRVGCFRPPSVPDGVSRLRITARASLRDDDLDRVVERLRVLVGRP